MKRLTGILTLIIGIVIFAVQGVHADDICYGSECLNEYSYGLAESNAVYPEFPNPPAYYIAPRGCPLSSGQPGRCEHSSGVGAICPLESMELFSDLERQLQNSYTNGERPRFQNQLRRQQEREQQYQGGEQFRSQDESNPFTDAPTEDDSFLNEVPPNSSLEEKTSVPLPAELTSQSGDRSLPENKRLSQKNVQPQSDIASIFAALSKLPPEDQLAVLSQRHCPVKGNVLGTLGLPIKVQYRGKEIYACCEDCAEKLKFDPGKSRIIEEYRTKPVGVKTHDQDHNH